jgi:hypothetical protein
VTTIAVTTSTKYAAIYSDQGITSDLKHHDMPKIVKQGTWLIAVTGEDRYCDVIQYNTTYPQVPETLKNKNYEEWHGWVVTKVIPKIQEALQKHINKDQTNLNGGEIFLITHGKAFLVTETLGLVKAAPYWAIGSGGQLALGTLSHRSQQADWERNHSNYAKEAIETAEKHDPFTRGKVIGYKSQLNGQITKSM